MAGEAITFVAVVDGDGEVWSLPKPARHHDVIRAMRQVGAPFVQEVECQGFLGPDGSFIGRKAAAKLALSSGQIESLKWPPHLYSEDLW